MSAELLREAAAEIRNNWEGAMPKDGRDGYTLSKVADWLENVAHAWDFTHETPASAVKALAVARDYLGRDS